VDRLPKCALHRAGLGIFRTQTLPGSRNSRRRLRGDVHRAICELQPARVGLDMTARLLMVLSASILLTLGTMHLAYTLWGTSFAPRDPALQVSMSRISPVLTKETTMWRCWMGFNARGRRPNHEYPGTELPDDAICPARHSHCNCPSGQSRR
jgi:hypothetical protein